MKKAKVARPKQWRHWCKSAGLKIDGDSSLKRKRVFCMDWYLLGHNRYWRVNIYGDFQCGGTFEKFDRWATTTTTQTNLPRSRAEFKASVQQLLDEHKLLAI